MEQAFDSDLEVVEKALVELASLDDPQAVEALESIAKWAPIKKIRLRAKALEQEKRAEGPQAAKEQPKPRTLKRQGLRATGRLVALVRPSVPEFMRPHVPRFLRRSLPVEPPPPVDEIDSIGEELRLTAAHQAIEELARKLGGLDTFSPDLGTRNARLMAERASLVWWAWFACFMGLSALSGLLMMRGGPNPSTIAWLVYLAGLVAIIYKPRYGIYLSIFFGLLGDFKLIPWFPFVKNFSSHESLLFLSNAVIISPLESYLVVTLLAWLGKGAMRREISIYKSELFWPAIVFGGFVCFGLVYGIGRGGNLNVALWEARAMLYLPLMLILTNNLLKKREHFSHLLWFAMMGLFIEGIAGVYFYVVEINMDLSLVQSITEHAAAIHMNTFFVLILAVWLFQGSIVKRLALPLLVPPVLLTYIATQRRASFLTLGVALFLMAFVLFKENRRVFFSIVPPLAVLAVLYVAAFWNSTGALALPAQAIKSVVAEDESNVADQASNVYRILENKNSAFTIHQVPLTGVGFGKKFYIIAPLPDISFFEWWEYITHNSIIWMWMKTGFGGFLSMLLLFGLSILVGVRAIWRLPGGDLSAAALTATLYIIMHFIYAYVDMSWDNQSMLYVGVMMGIVSCIERVVAKPVPLPKKRWPWQKVPPRAPSLVPLSFES